MSPCLPCFGTGRELVWRPSSPSRVRCGVSVEGPDPMDHLPPAGGGTPTSNQPLGGQRFEAMASLSRTTEEVSVFHPAAVSFD